MATLPGRYTLAKPDGEEETTRLNLQHRIWLTQHGDRLHTAGFDASKPHHVLDICCGNGIWTHAYARAHRHATILGVDISPPTSFPASLPSNLSFVYGDAEGDWSFSQGRPPFDFVYGRMLANSIRKWPHFYQQVYRHLSPGAWMQIDDIAHAFFADDLSITESVSPMMRWWRTVFQATSAHNGIDLRATYLHAGRILDAGFELKRADVVRWYFGRGEPSTAGEKSMADMWCEDISSIVPSTTSNAIEQGWLLQLSAEEARKLADEAVQDLQQNSVERGYYTEFTILVARKPQLPA